MQNSHSFTFDTNAAINSRSPTDDADGPRIASCVRRFIGLRMLGKLTREHRVDADDMRDVLAAGVSYQQIEDALVVCFAFNTTDRLADVLKFAVPGPKTFEAGAKFLLSRGYR